MTLGRPLAPLELTESDREQLASMAHSRSLPHGLVRRAEIVLLAADGWPNEAVAAAVGVTRATVGKWRQRFLNPCYSWRRHRQCRNECWKLARLDCEALRV